MNFRFLSSRIILICINLLWTMLSETLHSHSFLSSSNLVLILSLRTVVLWRYVAGLELYANFNFFHAFFVPTHGKLLMKLRESHLLMNCQLNVLSWLYFLNMFLKIFVIHKKICLSKNWWVECYFYIYFLKLARIRSNEDDGGERETKRTRQNTQSIEDMLNNDQVI